MFFILEFVCFLFLSLCVFILEFVCFLFLSLCVFYS